MPGRPDFLVELRGFRTSDLRSATMPTSTRSTSFVMEVRHLIRPQSSLRDPDAGRSRASSIKAIVGAKTTGLPTLRSPLALVSFCVSQSLSSMYSYARLPLQPDRTSSVLATLTIGAKPARTPSACASPCGEPAAQASEMRRTKRP